MMECGAPPEAAPATCRKQGGSTALDRERKALRL